MNTTTWSKELISAFKDIWSGGSSFLPELVIAILVLLVGWALGVLLGRIVTQAVRSIKFDTALARAGVGDILRKGNIALDSGLFLGALVKWFIIVVFLVASLDVLGLEQINIFLGDIVFSYLPRVIVAVLIVLIAAVIGDVMQRVVSASVRTADIKYANVVGKLTKWAIWIFAILVALDQLGIASAFIQTFFTGFVVAISLALGLSFGLGGKDAAAKFIESTRDEFKK